MSRGLRQSMFHTGYTSLAAVARAGLVLVRDAPTGGASGVADLWCSTAAVPRP
jgi:hypothetical protein